jgi:hypothetical protein
VIVAASARGQSQPPATEELQRELSAMQRKIEELQEALKKQQEAADQSSQVPHPPESPATDNEELEKRITENVMRAIQPSLTAANKTFPSQFNPAIGLIIDTVGSYSQNDGDNFELRAAELGFSANIDPFARGYGIFTGTDEGFEVEEAAIVTTSLPYNLTAKAGRFFADFGRLSSRHDHDLPFVNRPIVLDNYVNGESQATGVEVSYLAPMDQYLTLTAGMYNKIGAENERVDNAVPRGIGEFTYLVKPAMSFDLSDSSSLEVGATLAFTPIENSFTDADGVEQIRSGKPRYLADLDITYRYIPLESAQYQGLMWGTEILLNSEQSNFGDDVNPDLRRVNAFGFYSYLEAKMTRRYYAGFLVDFSQDITGLESSTTAYSPYFTIWLSEFDRLRLEYTRLDQPGLNDNQFFLQWTVILGSHVHGFRDR